MNVYWVLDRPLLVLLPVYFLYYLSWLSGRLSSRGRKCGHWGGVWDMVGVSDEDTTTMSMASFWCLCCLLWTCFALPSAVSIFGFDHVGIFLGHYLS